MNKTINILKEESDEETELESDNNITQSEFGAYNNEIYMELESVHMDPSNQQQQLSVNTI